MKTAFTILVTAVLLCGVAFAQHETAGIQDQPPTAVVVRADAGIGPNQVEITARHPDGTIFVHQVVHNLKTYAGGDFIASVMSNTSAQPASANYLALSADGTAPAAGDTVMAGEISTNNLGRHIAAYAHTACGSFPCTYTLTYTWTAGGTQNGIVKAGVFNAASSGTMVFENTFSSVSLNSNDTLQLTWTITIQ